MRNYYSAPADTMETPVGATTITSPTITGYEIFAAFRNAPAFRGVDDDALYALAAASKVRELPPRAMALWVDESPHALVVMGAGHCQLLRLNSDGETALVRSLSQGDLLASMPGGCYLESAAPRTVVHIVTYPTYVRVSAQFPAVRLAIDLAIRCELDNELEEHADLATCDGPTRLAHLLARLAREHASPVVSVAPQEMARIIGCPRESVDSWLAEFAHSGLIHREQGGAAPGRIQVLDVVALGAQ